MKLFQSLFNMHQNKFITKSKKKIAKAEENKLFHLPSYLIGKTKADWFIIGEKSTKRNKMVV